MTASTESQKYPRKINEELLAIIKADPITPDYLRGNAILYLNRQTYEELKREYPSAESSLPWRLDSIIAQMFGIPMMLYHGIPIGRWELVQRDTGENILAGNMWEDDPPNNSIMP